MGPAGIAAGGGGQAGAVATGAGAAGWRPAAPRPGARRARWQVGRGRDRGHLRRVLGLDQLPRLVRFVHALIPAPDGRLDADVARRS